MGLLHWRSQWQELSHVLISRGLVDYWYDDVPGPPRFEIAPPATESEVLAMESKLGQPVPYSLRRIFREFSASVRIGWRLDDRTVLPPEFRGIFSGFCCWSLNELPDLRIGYEGWITDCFSGKSSADWIKGEDEIAYDLVWHRKFPILGIPNGDMLGIDISDNESQSVVYLSHEGGDLHGRKLGDDFEDYVSRLTALAFVGSEEWQLQRFMGEPNEGLQIQGENANAWRRWLGLTTNDH